MPIANCAELQQTIQFQSCANILLPQTGAQAKQQQHTDSHTLAVMHSDAYAPTHPAHILTHTLATYSACQIRSRSKLINNAANNDNFPHGETTKR